MIKLYGSTSCTRCEMVKNVLETKGVEYEYSLLEDAANQDELIAKAQEKGLTTLPLIFKNDEIITIEEV